MPVAATTIPEPLKGVARQGAISRRSGAGTISVLPTPEITGIATRAVVPQAADRPPRAAPRVPIARAKNSAIRPRRLVGAGRPPSVQVGEVDRQRTGADHRSGPTARRVAISAERDQRRGQRQLGAAGLGRDEAGAAGRPDAREAGAAWRGSICRRAHATEREGDPRRPRAPRPVLARVRPKRSGRGLSAWVCRVACVQGRGVGSGSRRQVGVTSAGGLHRRPIAR